MTALAEAPARPAGWDNILAEGEEILWQGRPDDRVAWSDLVSFQSAFGAVFFGFACFWILMAAAIGGGFNDGPPGFALFPLFGLPFVAVGLYLMVGRIFVDAWQRRRTHYTLTNRAAYIATELAGKRSLKSWPIDGDSLLDLEDDDPGTVWFAEEVRSHVRSRGRGPNGMSRGSRTQTTRHRIGFRRIAEARKVYGLLRRMQVPVEATRDVGDPRVSHALPPAAGRG